MKKLLLNISIILAFLFSSSSLAWAVDPDNLWFTVPLAHAPGIQDDAPTVGADKVRDSDRLGNADRAYFSFYYDHSDSKKWYVNQKGVKTECSIDEKDPAATPGPCATAPIFISAGSVTGCMALEYPVSESMDAFAETDLMWQVVACSDKNCTSYAPVPKSLGSSNGLEACFTDGFQHNYAGGLSLSGQWLFIRKNSYNVQGSAPDENELGDDHILRVWLIGSRGGN